MPNICAACETVTVTTDGSSSNSNGVRRRLRLGLMSVVVSVVSVVVDCVVVIGYSSTRLVSPKQCLISPN